MPDLAVVSTSVLSLHISNVECATVLRCQGMLTLESSNFLKAEVKSRIPEKGRLVLDLSDVSRMDSSGLGAIVGLYLSAKSKDCDFELINLNQQIRKLFAISNLLSIFETTGRQGMRMQ
jgi:anti-anti-sigma factor